MPVTPYLDDDKRELHQHLFLKHGMRNIARLGDVDNVAMHQRHRIAHLIGCEDHTHKEKK